MSFYDKRRGIIRDERDGGERWGALPLGELHDYGRCAHCGARGEVGRELQRTVLLSTHAVAMVCADMMACIRRRRRAAA